ncbi:transcriptional repressor [Variovorax arabinosiphilus]|uniref:transcriptional repressor n=1 Tax=Variovorax arabinosiphilus TaxID=3053498 RepID=UPI002576E734|nr:MULTISPECIES: transcriptional repressor [unclassified Variovorax]MDM0120256.1 transcriptional repressor [Variovorax sp. J2L1-78]MDM0127832.1 transcriptional repressor [Variovorax sp. J2L1-63]MDM0231531.1 transcriptional repressor [Variovorax sp. J2R1-6]
MSPRSHSPTTGRLGAQHDAVLSTLRAMPTPEPDAHTIYRALLTQGQDMPLSTLYRALKALESAGLVRRQWAPHHGRPRGVYSATGDSSAAAQAGAVCAHCGAHLATTGTSS